MVLPRRHQECGVVEAGGALVVGLGVWPVLDLEQRHAVDAELRHFCVRSSTVSPSRCW